MSGERVEKTGTERGVHPVDEVLPAGRLAIFGFQHVLAMYAGAVAATGIRTLSRVDFERNANVIIVANSLALGIIPVAVQDFYANFPPGMQIVLNSGITAGSIAAIVLNIAFNILGSEDESPDPTSGATARTRGDARGPV